jgi:molybdopterin converting factor small subunit
MMAVRVLFFSVLQDLTGCAEWSVELPEAADVGGLLSLVYERWPALRGWDESLLVAVDLEFARRDFPLSAGCEVALMPPVQGG